MKPCLCATARQAARVLTQVYEEELRQSGLHPAQFEILSCLSQMEPASQSSVARVVGADQTTLSRSMKLLVRDGMVDAFADETDRRHVRYKLTRKGRERLRVAGAEWNRAQKRMERALGSEFAQTMETLQKLIAAAQR